MVDGQEVKRILFNTKDSEGQQEFLANKDFMLIQEHQDCGTYGVWWVVKYSYTNSKTELARFNMNFLEGVEYA